MLTDCFSKSVPKFVCISFVFPASTFIAWTVKLKLPRIFSRSSTVSLNVQTTLFALIWHVPKTRPDSSFNVIVPLNPINSGGSANVNVSPAFISLPGFSLKFTCMLVFSP